METETLALLIPILSVIGVFTMIIFLRRYENEERMAMIDKGISPEIFRKAQNTSVALRFALLFIGGGTGLLMGYFLDQAFGMEEVAYFSMLFIFGGLGLGAAYIVEERKAKEGK